MTSVLPLIPSRPFVKWACYRVVYNEVDSGAAGGHLCNRATAIGWSSSRLNSELAVFSSYSTLQLVHGHDLIKIFSIGLKRPIGNSNVGEDTLAENLMLAFGEINFKYKKLIKDLRLWAGSRVLL